MSDVAICNECGREVIYDPEGEVTVDANNPEMEHECNPDDDE